MKKQFIEFLHNNGCYRKYFNYATNRRLDEIQEPRRYISGAFILDTTKEGAGYWWGISQKWQEELKRLRTKGHKMNSQETLEQAKKRHLEELKAIEERKLAEEKAKAEKEKAEVEAYENEVKRVIENDVTLDKLYDMMSDIKNPKINLRYKTLKKAFNERLEEIKTIIDKMKK